jgi:hypothetical protein
VKRGIDIYRLSSVLILVLTVSSPLACGSCATAIQSRPEYSAASIKGTYQISATAKPYVKFAGGPRLGSGTVYFDGRGNLQGTQTWFGNEQSMSGTYIVNPDGQGRATIIATDSSGAVSPKSEIDFQLVNPSKIQFESRGMVPERSGEDLDWNSSAYCQQTTNPCATGVMTKE